MNILLDTSVLIAAMVETHPMHSRALPWLQRIHNEDDTGIVAAHSIAELYAILTRLPLQPRISPTLAKQLIYQNVQRACRVVPIDEKDYIAVIEHLANAYIVGGVVYDALILYVAFKIKVDQIVTLNAKDFRRIYPTLVSKVIEP